MPWQPVTPETYVSHLSAPLPDPALVFATPGYSQPPTPRNPLATVSLILGLVGIIVPGVALAAIITGHLAASGRNPVGRNLARGGYGLGWLMLGVWAMIAIIILVMDAF